MKKQNKECIVPYPQLIKTHGGSAQRTGRAMDHRNRASDRLAFLLQMAIDNMRNVARQSFQFPVPHVSIPKPLNMIEKLQLIDDQVKRELEKVKNNYNIYLQEKQASN